LSTTSFDVALSNLHTFYMYKPITFNFCCMNFLPQPQIVDMKADQGKERMEARWKNRRRNTSIGGSKNAEKVPTHTEHLHRNSSFR
jgi:hypothetical protein